MRQPRTAVTASCRSATKSKDLNVWPASVGRNAPDLGESAGASFSMQVFLIHGPEQRRHPSPFARGVRETDPLRGQCSSLQANEQHGVRLAAPNKIAQIAGHLPGVGGLCGLLLPGGHARPSDRGEPMAQPLQAQEARRRFPGGLTGDALLHRDHTPRSISSGLISFGVDLLADSGCPSGRAVTSQQVVRQLCSSSQPQRRSIRLLDHLYWSDVKCAVKYTSSCDQTIITNTNDPLNAPGRVLDADLSNMSDDAAKNDAFGYLERTEYAIRSAGSTEGTASWKVATKYYLI